MNIKTLSKLISLVEKSNINELEVEEDNLKVRIKKAPPVYNYSAEFATIQPVAPAMIPMGGKPLTAAIPQEVKPATVEKTEIDPNLKEVISPMVGTFYRSSGPGRPNYVGLGDVVKKGDTLCIIEAMKLMNEIEAPYDGKIDSVLAENAQPVEFGEKLFLIRAGA
ncbi:MAG: acetyl-CoA carboxylase biotin carboxyl carrier protein [Candidatus Schekmanbacteria bacterium]|nr:acetyl-CoA carboxylase biotin carboxyl carrier protein [Candidatus Schekmanbacteria bacterium]